MDEGRRLRDEGMALATDHTDAEWRERADKAIAWLAMSGPSFTAEDVAEIAGRPARPNALGARISAAARKGIIREDGYVQAERAPRHASRMLRWRGTGIIEPPQSRDGYMRPNRREGRPDQYVDLSKSAAMSIDQTRAQRLKAEEGERRRTPRIAPGLLKVRFGDNICRSCRGTGGNLIERCLRCNGVGIEP